MAGLTGKEHTLKFILDCAHERDLAVKFGNALADAVKKYTREPKIVRGVAYRALVIAWQDYTREVRNVPVTEPPPEPESDEWKPLQ